MNGRLRICVCSEWGGWRFCGFYSIYSIYGFYIFYSIYSFYSVICFIRGIAAGCFVVLAVACEASAEGLAEEEHEDDYSHTDARVGKVEHRAEEYAVFACIGQEADGVEPRPRHGHVPLYEREVEHIDHFAFEQRCISLAPAGHDRHVGVGRLGEHHTIEYAVDDVAYCSAYDEGEAHHEAHVLLAVQQPQGVVDDDAYGEQAEDGEEYLRAERPTECHAFVFDKSDVEPVGHDDVLAEGHGGLDLIFYDLVDDDHHEHYG